ncbi:MAG: hypothetical protein ABWZ66_12210 [Pyrinomonadaceae bacterium]
MFEKSAFVILQTASGIKKLSVFLLYLIAAVLTLTVAGAVNAQTKDAPKYEIGGRFAHNVTNDISLEAETNFFPNNKNDRRKPNTIFNSARE